MVTFVSRELHFSAARGGVVASLGRSLRERVPVLHESMFAGLDSEARLLAYRVRYKGTKSIHERRDHGAAAAPRNFLAVLDQSGRVLELTDEACFTPMAELQRDLVAGRRRVFTLCGRQIAALVAWPLPEGGPAGHLVVGRVLGDSYVEDVARFIGTEVLVRDAGGLVATSLRDLEDKQVLAPLPGRVIDALAAGQVGQIETLRLGRYRGFSSDGERFEAGADQVRFFLGAGRLPNAAEGSGLQLVLAAPVSVVTRGTDLATLLQGISAIVLAGGLSLLLLRLFAQQSRPLYELRDATARVAEGDFTVEVTPAASGESRKVAASFNAMVRRLREASTRLVHVEKLASMGTLAAGVAHEINNPLAFVSSNLEYVEDELRRVPGLDPAKIAGLLEAIADARDGARRMRTIVRDMRLFGGNGEENPGRLDLRPLLESSINLASSHLLDKARLVRDYGEVPEVLGIPHRLGQVFLNLLVNAAQAIRVGSSETNVIQVRTRVERGKAVIEVIDTGEGIRPEHLKRLFDPFFTTKPVGEGTGLGLSICHGIVAALGGSMEVESNLGAGSTFRVLLPLAPTEPVRTGAIAA